VIATRSGCAIGNGFNGVQGFAIWNFAPPTQVPERNAGERGFYHSLASLSFKLESRLSVTPVENGIRYAEDN
jgi:hypothetical protein